MSRTRAGVLTGLALAGTAAVDWITGTGIWLTLVYLLLTQFAAWTLGRRWGYATAFGCMLAIVAANGLQPFHPVPPGHFSYAAAAWNIVSRSAVLAIVAAVVSGLRRTLEAERQRSTTDPLTGALNKAGFTAAMAQAVARARRSGEALALLYIDLDGFKGVNDRFGHAAGDDVLRAFTAGAAQTLRAGDVFARIGGDEFVALLSLPDPQCGEKVTTLIHERLSLRLKATGHAVGCSAGAVIMTADQAPESTGEMMHLADQLMYEVKRNGKGGVRIARADLTGSVLRQAFPPSPSSSAFDSLLRALDAPARKAA